MLSRTTLDSYHLEVGFGSSLPVLYLFVGLSNGLDFLSSFQFRQRKSDFHIFFPQHFLWRKVCLCHACNLGKCYKLGRGKAERERVEE